MNYRIVIDLILSLGLGIISSIPLPVALLSRRHIETTFPASGSNRIVRNAGHVILIFLAVLIPWVMFGLSNKWDLNSTIDTIAFSFAILVTFIALIWKWRLHDSRTWKR